MFVTMRGRMLSTLLIGPLVLFNLNICSSRCEQQDADSSPGHYSALHIAMISSLVATSFSASATSNFAAEDVLVNSFIHRSILRVKELLVDWKISRQGESTFLMLRNRNFAPH
jgi:hypothetical protein